MDGKEVESFLAASLADRKMTGSERHALADYLNTHARNAQDKGVVRHLAFELARRALSNQNDTKILDWMEEVLKVVAPIQSNATAPDMAPDSAYFSPGDECLQRIIRRFQLVKKHADLCVFTITDDRISREILEAHGRGVKVRIISDEEKASDTGSDMRQFTDAGIPIKLIRAVSADGRDGHMHHKFAIFDGLRLVNGSYNWTRGAANINYENLVDSADAGMVQRFSAEFNRLWAL